MFADVPMSHSHQLEVNVAGNQGGGSAKLEPSDLLKMICEARNFSMPQYSSSPIAVHGRRTRKIFEESVFVPQMNLRGILHYVNFTL